MAKLNINVPHELERKVVVKRLQSFSGKVREQFAGQVSSIEENWDEDNDSLNFAVKARGMSIKGNLEVTDNSIDVQTSLPFAALPFRGLVETYIRNAIQDAVGSA